MATKDFSFSSNDNIDNGFDQYSNLNLNQNYKCSDFNSVESKSGSSNKGTPTILDDCNDNDFHSGKKINSSYNISPKQQLHDFQEEDKKQWNKDDKDASVEGKNQSTLSLHIASYEKAVEGAESDEQHELFVALNKNTFSKVDVQNLNGRLNSNMFEFPRMDKENRPKKSEVQKFKASQQLLNPNQSSRNGAASRAVANNPPSAPSTSSATTTTAKNISTLNDAIARASSSSSSAAPSASPSASASTSSTSSETMTTPTPPSTSTSTSSAPTSLTPTSSETNSDPTTPESAPAAATATKNDGIISPIISPPTEKSGSSPNPTGSRTKMDEPLKILSRSDAEIAEYGIDIARWEELKKQYPNEKRSMKNKPQIGSKIHSFTVLVEAGSGGCIVFVVERDGKLYAMKYTNEDRFNLEKEYETSQKCWNKEKLLKCLQFVRCETYSYLIMELTGQTLEAALSSDDITLKEICRLYIEALQGLEQLHGLNMIHQDFKPNNLAISLRRPGKVVVIDFGAVAEIVKGRCINGCMGTKTFAARDAMDKKKQGQQYFRSDLESWYYCLVSACKDGKLGWEYLRSYDAILAEKKNAWKKVNRRRFLSGLPVQFLDIMKLIDQMRQTRGQTYQPYYDLLNLIVEAESPVLVPAVEPFSFAATESEEDDPYLYYETHGEKKGIRKAGNNYTKQSKLVNHESGKLAVMKCRTKTKTGKECNFRAYVDANMFQRAKHGDVARIVKTSDNGHQH